MRSDLVVVCAYFNSCRFDKRRANYDTFRDGMDRADVSVTTVEVVVGDAEHELTGYDGTLCYRARDVMWHKERAMQLGVDHVLRTTDAPNVMWVDADAVFPSHDWVDRILRALDVHRLVHCFNAATTHYSDGNLERYSSVECYKNNVPFGKGVPGGCWAARRDFFDHISFYQHAIAGGGDTLFGLAMCLTFGFDYQEFFKEITKHNASILKWSWPIQIHWMNWARRVQQHIQSSEVGFVNQHAHFLEHGSKKNRWGSVRYTIMQEVDPYADVAIDTKSQMMQWISDKPELHQRLVRYFKDRDAVEQAH